MEQNTFSLSTKLTFENMKVDFMVDEVVLFKAES